MTGLLVQPKKWAFIALAFLCGVGLVLAPGGADARTKKPRAAKVGFKVPTGGRVAVIKFNVKVRSRRAPKLKLRGKGLPSDLFAVAHRVRLKKPKRSFAYTIVVARAKAAKSSSRGQAAQGGGSG